MPFDVEESDYLSVFKGEERARADEQEVYGGKGKGKAREAGVEQEPVSSQTEIPEGVTPAQQDQPDTSSGGTQSELPSSSQSEEPSKHEIEMAKYDEWLKERGIDMRDKHFTSDPSPSRKRWQTEQKGPRKLPKLGVGLPPRIRKTQEQLEQEAEVEREWLKLDRLLCGPQGGYYAPHLDEVINRTPTPSDPDSE